MRQQSLHSISETSKKVRSPVKMLFKSSLVKLKDKKVADGRAELHAQPDFSERELQMLTLMEM